LDKFICDRCGSCCRSIGKSVLFADLDKGGGICGHLDEETNLCTIYNERPLFCDVEKAYEAYFADVVDIEEYFLMNRKACAVLKGLRND
jgi:Fe-S-cluster containining protein